MAQSLSLERDVAQGLAGTLAYLAPETRDGLAATPAADVFSAGVVLFEMLTGQRPCGVEKPSEVRQELGRARQWDQLFSEACCSQRRRLSDAQKLLARYFELFEASSLSEACDSARRGDLGKVANFVLAHPELIDACSTKGGLLHNAARNGRLEIAAFLIQHGACVGALDQRHETPLHYASRWNRVLVAKFLLANGAKPNSPNKSGVTPLHYASMWGNREVAQLLLSSGATPVPTRRGVTPLHWAARWGHVGVAQLVASQGSVKAKTQAGVLPLHLAASGGHAGVVSLLLQAGADTSPQTVTGWTPLHFAVRRGSAEVLNLLLDAGANSSLAAWSGTGARERMSPSSREKFTALDLAERCYCHNPAIAKILRERYRK